MDHQVAHKQQAVSQQVFSLRSLKHPLNLWVFLLCVIFVGGLNSCKNTTPPQKAAPEQAIQSKEEKSTLTIVTRRGLSTYFENQLGPNGFEYQLANALAQSLGKQLKVVTADSIEGVFEALTTGKADIAAANIIITDQRRKDFAFTQPYLEVKPLALYRLGKKPPKNMQALEKRDIAVQANSSHAEQLERLKQDYSKLKWREIASTSTEELIEQLDKKQLDIVIADSNEYQMLQNRHPLVKVAFELSTIEYVGWAMAKKHNPELFKQAQSFLTKSKKNGKIAHLHEMFYGHYNESFKAEIDSYTFAFNLEKRLPKYKKMIKSVANEFNLDWRLVAAIAYQESHWRPRAKSPTGVRGMMMLTKPTAKEVGVTNRLDPKQSLQGGARYFINIYNRLPSGITEPDRTWFALAAYNVGFGHLRDAREITEFQGANPNRWVEVKSRLPLLEKKEWYHYADYGYARGREPVTYVQRIRHYFELLAWHFPEPNLDRNTLLAYTKTASK